MATTDVELPVRIRVDGTMTPNEMRALKHATGRSLTELMGGDPEDLELAPDRLQSLVWVALRRAGHDVSWEQAGDVLPDMEAPAPDPTLTASSNSSSTSAGSGA